MRFKIIPVTVLNPTNVALDALLLQNKQSCLGKMLSDGSAYEGCGQILFNNTVPSGAKLRELIGYGKTFF